MLNKLILFLGSVMLLLPTFAQSGDSLFYRDGRGNKIFLEEYPSGGHSIDINVDEAELYRTKDYKKYCPSEWTSLLDAYFVTHEKECLKEINKKQIWICSGKALQIKQKFIDPVQMAAGVAALSEGCPVMSLRPYLRWKRGGAMKAILPEINMGIPAAITQDFFVSYVGALEKYLLTLNTVLTTKRYDGGPIRIDDLFFHAKINLNAYKRGKISNKLIFDIIEQIYLDKLLYSSGAPLQFIQPNMVYSY